MLVDIKTEQGEKLYEGVFTGETKFPDEYSRLLTAAYTFVRSAEDSVIKQGVVLLAKALELNPSQKVVIELLRSAKRHKDSETVVGDILKSYFEQFVANKAKYKEEDGYGNKLVAAMLSGDYLSSINNKTPKLADYYRNRVKEYRKEHSNFQKTSRW